MSTKEITPAPTLASAPSTSHFPAAHDNKKYDNVFVSTPQPNLPNRDLLTGSRKAYLKFGVPLYEASVKCDWKAAKAIIDERPELVRYSITENGETALHVAASAKGPKHVEVFVKNLVDLMNLKDLALENENFNTALYSAVSAGNIETVKIMVKKNRDLRKIPGAEQQMLPLYAAALFGHHDVVKYLFKMSNDLGVEDGWNPQNRGWLVEKCVENDMFDVALQIVTSYPEVGRGTVLRVLAGKPEAFRETKSNIFGKTTKPVLTFIHSKMGNCEKENKALPLLRAVWNDIAELPKNEIDKILRGPPDPSKQDKLASGKAVQAIQLQNLIIEHLEKMLAISKNTLTQDTKPVPGTSAKDLNDASGVALRMQRELLWFQEVKQMIPPSYRERKNKDGLMPHELFTTKHRDLVAQSGQWMKETASQCMVVAALIATIVFAAAFTIPGGYDQNSGLPKFQSKATLIVFVVADAISLFSSSASILIFLAILTSRYAERDFLESLPRKLMFGIATLFLSITTMTVVFGVSFFVLYHKGLLWIPILICVLAVMPVLLYVRLQYSLFFDVIRATYGSKYLFKPTKHVLYYENPKV